jgi:hypothetical protein
MTTVPKPALAKVFLSILTCAAIALTPWVLLLASRISPLHSHSSDYINGFAMGVAFVFFQLAGLWFLVGSIGTYRRAFSKRRPAN